MKIVGLSGSLRKGSFSTKILQSALQLAKEKGMEVDEIDLNELNLPFCDGSKTYPLHPGVEILKEKIKSSKAIIIVTPEYHGSLSGVLKNALDLLDTEQVAGKVVAIIGVMGGAYSLDALNTLRLVFRQLNAWVVPQQLVVSKAYDALDEHGKLKNSDHQNRLIQLVDTLLDASRRFHN